MAGGLLEDGIIKRAGATNPNWISNLSIVPATTTNANDSIKITSADGTPLSTSNKGWLTIVSSGVPVVLGVTADVTINLTGAHWGIGTTGDISGALLRVLAIYDGGNLEWGVAYIGGRVNLLTTNGQTTATSVTSPQRILCVSPLNSNAACREIGFVRANFDDTGGAAEDLWEVVSGRIGISADGLWQPWNPTYTGFSVNPGTPITAKWTQIGRAIHIAYRSGTQGTSNSTGFTMTLPTEARSAEVSFSWGLAMDNSVDLLTPIQVGTTANSTTLTIDTDGFGGLWTAAGGKRASGNLTYEVGPVASFIGL